MVAHVRHERQRQDKDPVPGIERGIRRWLEVEIFRQSLCCAWQMANFRRYFWLFFFIFVNLMHEGSKQHLFPKDESGADAMNKFRNDLFGINCHEILNTQSL